MTFTYVSLPHSPSYTSPYYVTNCAFRAKSLTKRYGPHLYHGEVGDGSHEDRRGEADAEDEEEELPLVPSR